MRWDRVEGRISELEDKQSELLEEYNGIVELIKEDLEEQDLDSFKRHVADITDILKNLESVRDELSYLGDLIDDAVDDARMARYE